MIDIYRRFLTDELTLPYSFEEVKVPYNEISDVSTLNRGFNKLNENFIYLKNNTSFVNNIYIENENSILYFNENNSLSAINLTSLNNISISAALFEYINIETYKETYNNVERTIMMMHTLSSIDFYVGDNQKYSNDLQSPTLEYSFTQVQNSGDYKFKNISSIKVNKNKKLYVCDSELKLILKYNVEDIFYFNIAYDTQQLELIYNGDVDDTSVIDFIPKYLDIDDVKNEVYVYDLYSNKIFRYTNNLSILNSFTLSHPEIEVVDIKFYKDQIYVLYKNGYLSIYSKTGELIKAGFMVDPLQQEENEEYIRLSFSTSIEDAFYILTNKTLFRKYVDKFDENIGSFIFPQLVTFDVIGASSDGVSLSALDLNDSILGRKTFSGINYINLSYNNGNLYVLGDRIILNLEDIENFESIADLTTINNVLQNVILKDDELEQDTTFNYLFQSLYYNHALLYHSVKEKIIVDYTSKGEKIFLDTKTVTKPAIPYDTSYLIGINEVYSSAIINRGIKSIYDFQLKIIEILKSEELEKNPITLLI